MRKRSRLLMIDWFNYVNKELTWNFVNSSARNSSRDNISRTTCCGNNVNDPRVSTRPPFSSTNSSTFGICIHMISPITLNCSNLFYFHIFTNWHKAHVVIIYRYRYEIKIIKICLLNQYKTTYKKFQHIILL